MARSAERTGFLGDIITTAVEGGTGYWAQVSQYTHTDVDGRGTRATLHELDDDEGYREEGLELTIEGVATALGQIRRGEIGINGRLRECIALGDRENDGGEIDADAADVITQIALLGEIRYG